MNAELVVPPLTELRLRRSVKWRAFADDVLPLFVAEMDYVPAPFVTEVLTTAVSRGDLGYHAPGPELGKAFAGFAGRQWGWDVDPAQVHPVTDVGVGVVEVLRQLIRHGEPVVISPPVYAPFFDWVPEAGGRAIEVPLVGNRLDLAGLEAAFATHPAAYVLCNPHNPAGRVHTADELAELVRLARLHRVPIISDEIHGPLVLPGATFTPLLTVPGAAEVALAAVSASKAFNLAGLRRLGAGPRQSTPGSIPARGQGRARTGPALRGDRVGIRPAELRHQPRNPRRGGETHVSRRGRTAVERRGGPSGSTVVLVD